MGVEPRLRRRHADDLLQVRRYLWEDVTSASMASDDARTVLGRLAGAHAGEDGSEEATPATDYGVTIERATAALDDLDAAAAFVADGGLHRLEEAVERAEVDLSDRATAGRETLRQFRALKAAARSDAEAMDDGIARRE